MCNPCSPVRWHAERSSRTFDKGDQGASLLAIKSDDSRLTYCHSVKKNDDFAKNAPSQRFVGRAQPTMVKLQPKVADEGQDESEEGDEGTGQQLDDDELEYESDNAMQRPVCFSMIHLHSTWWYVLMPLPEEKISSESALHSQL